MTEYNDSHRDDPDPIRNPAGEDAGSDFDEECAVFQTSMAERIQAGEDLQENPHMLTCERCRELVSELEAIAEVARQLMPLEVEPREDLWTKIQLAIETGEA